MKRHYERLDTDRTQPDRDIKRLEIAMELADLRLEQAAAEGTERLAEVSEEVITELDAAWPYSMHEFLVVGKWRSPNLISPGEGDDDDEEDGSVAVAETTSLNFSVDFSKQEVMEQALSQGFAVDNFHIPPRVGYIFSRFGPLTVSFAPFIHMAGGRTGVAMPEEVSLSYVGPSELGTPTSAVWENLLERLDRSERLHELYVSQPNFYDVSPKRQTKVMEGLIADINKQLQIVSGLKVNATTNRTFVPGKEDGGEFNVLFSPEKQYTIQGRLASVGMFNMSTIEAGRLRSPADLYSQHGVYLDLVDLEAPTPTQITERQVARVSFRSVQPNGLRLVTEP